jgi:hypothetical protein
MSVWAPVLPTDTVRSGSLRAVSQAVCENGHPLTASESRCSQCGARMKMQWMDGSTPPASKASGSAPRSQRPPASQPAPASWLFITWAIFIAGTLLLGIGIAIILNGPASISWLGYLLSGVGGLAAQIATIALGVRLGTRED